MGVWSGLVWFITVVTLRNITRASYATILLDWTERERMIKRARWEHSAFTDMKLTCREKNEQVMNRS